MLAITSAILSDLRNELRVATTDEFHLGTPVLGRLLGSVAHELDMLVKLHARLQTADSDDVAVIPANNLAGAMLALGMTYGWLVNFTYDQLETLTYDISRALCAHCDNIGTTMRLLTGADPDPEFVEIHGRITEILDERRVRADTRPDDATDDGDQSVSRTGD